MAIGIARASSRLFSVSSKVLIGVLFFAEVSITQAAETPHFTSISKGLLPQYTYGDDKRQDVSGAAVGQGIVLLADDGGAESYLQEVRLTATESLATAAPVLKRQVKQKDMEGMTYRNGIFYITSSMSQVFEESDDYLVLAELSIDKNSKKVVSEKYVYMRDAIINTLRDRFQNQSWYARMSTSFAKEGGLNVEGLSVSHLDKDSLVFGLRSPLWGKNFGSSKFGNEFSLTKGDALLVHVKSPFGVAPEYVVETLPLDGLGIRSIEFVPQLLGGGYLIIAGPVEKDSSAFKLWWYRPGAAPEQVKVEGFEQLCRPESIMVDATSKRVYLMSEQSGEACANQKFTYIELGY